MAAGAPFLSTPFTGATNEMSNNNLQSRGATSISLNSFLNPNSHVDSHIAPTKILINGEPASETPTYGMLPSPTISASVATHSFPPSSSLNGGSHTLADVGNTTTYTPDAPEHDTPCPEAMDQSAHFFDPSNTRAAQLREEVAMATLDDLLDYILDQGGSVGIFDATNSTLERRKLIMERIRARAGPELGVLFLESLCIDENVCLDQNWG